MKLSSVVQVPCIHRTAITSLAVSADSRFVATGGADFLIKIWDITMPGMPIPPYQSFMDLEEKYHRFQDSITLFRSHGKTSCLLQCERNSY